MRRVIAIVVACALAGALGGCSSFSMDAFRAAPPTVQVELDSVPPGADAVTSVGPSCKTPCSVAVAAPDAGFSVTYTLNKFQPLPRPGAGLPFCRGFPPPCLDQRGSQSRGRGTQAGRTAAEGAPQGG